jgi:hypothetical protein
MRLRGGTLETKRLSSGGKISHMDRTTPIELIRSGQAGLGVLSRSRCLNLSAVFFAAWSMRPWESVRHLKFHGGRTHSQDRMELMVGGAWR